LVANAGVTSDDTVTADMAIDKNRVSGFMAGFLKLRNVVLHTVALQSRLRKPGLSVGGKPTGRAGAPNELRGRQRIT
jgi:hypothetical protein